MAGVVRSVERGLGSYQVCPDPVQRSRQLNRAASKEIAVARSYGDLRENFEYQAAKDMQRMLMQRHSEFENDLAIVRGTDFKSLPSEVGGMGTKVLVRRPTEQILEFCILGEWDRDETLKIISNKSQIALILKGRKTGDKVSLPLEHGGEEECTVEAVQPLPLDVQQWAKEP